MTTSSTLTYDPNPYSVTDTYLNNDKFFLTTPVVPIWETFDRKDYISGIKDYTIPTTPVSETNTGISYFFDKEELYKTITGAINTTTSTNSGFSGLTEETYKTITGAINTTTSTNSGFSGLTLDLDYSTENSLKFITGTTSFNITNSGYISTGSDKLYTTIKKSSKVTKKFNIKMNLAVHTKSRAISIKNIPENEQTALETLREEISESEFRKYIKYGFVLVKGQSGNTYQIFRNQSHTKVWKGGKLIEEICVRIKDYKIPPTDNVIAFKTIIETDENEFKKLGNVYRRMDRAA